jgi:hypothetical protein
VSDDAAGETPAPGAIERTVRRDIDDLNSGHPLADALAEMAYKLARTLDEGAGLATAAVNRELRATIVELATFEVDDGAGSLEAELSEATPGTAPAAAAAGS